jgi:hypothetical protein
LSDIQLDRDLELTEVTLCIKPGHIVPVGVSALLQLLVVRGDIWVSIIIQGASRNIILDKALAVLA